MNRRGANSSSDGDSDGGEDGGDDVGGVDDNEGGDNRAGRQGVVEVISSSEEEAQVSIYALDEESRRVRADEERSLRRLQQEVRRLGQEELSSTVPIVRRDGSALWAGKRMSKQA